MSNLDKLVSDAEVVNYRNTILSIVGDMVSNLLYYDRKGCEVLPMGALEEAVEKGDITVDEIAECFKESLSKKLEGHYG